MMMEYIIAFVWGFVLGITRHIRITITLKNPDRKENSYESDKRF